MVQDEHTQIPGALVEEPMQFGEDGRLFGIVTRPSSVAARAAELPVFVFLSAGLLHRVGPYRLHVRVARELAQLGFCSLRVDLAGIGDSPPLRSVTHQKSIAADFAAILTALESRVGTPPLILVGLCTGADNAIHLALGEERVIGMVLLDPVCYPDRGLVGFGVRRIVRYARLSRYDRTWWRRRLVTLKRLFGSSEGNPPNVDPLALRDLPTHDQLRAAFESIRERNGLVLSVFTRYSLGYYNRTGQLGRALGVKGYEQFCTETYWPRVDHTYRLELHRSRLIEAIRVMAEKFLFREASALKSTGRYRLPPAGKALLRERDPIFSASVERSIPPSA